MKQMTGGDGWALIPDQSAGSPGTGVSRQPEPKIRVEKRAGKKVTIITGLHTYGEDRLQEIARSLKARCAAGGTVKNGTIEIQGDKAVQVQQWFAQQKK